MIMAYTDKELNLGQLSTELGDAPILAFHDDDYTLYVEGVTQAELDAAIEAHVPDPQWVAP